MTTIVVTVDAPPTITGPLAEFIEGHLDDVVEMPQGRGTWTPRTSPGAWWSIVGRLRTMGYEVAVTDVGQDLGSPSAPDGPVYSPQIGADSFGRQ